MIRPPPGAEPLPADLWQRLQKIDEQGKGAAEAEAEPRFANRLMLETSPYLLQHAHNPVNWFPWGAPAFEEAKRLKRPVLLSVGYSTCHWCHVMERESFEDLEIAELINRSYVAIKVDREERPDVDAVYMSAVQQLSGSGGWPMTVWLTDDRRPFFGGTYFPARDGDRGSHKGFRSLLEELRALFDRDAPRIEAAAASLTQAVREELEGGPAPTGRPAPLPADFLDQVMSFFVRNFDGQNGGLRRAPKFPSSLPIRLLMRRHQATGNGRFLEMAQLTLEKMAAGGIYDQLAGGFHRYSTDERWLVPHFEKMLYDNALLAVVYLEAFQLTGRPDLARVARETLEYLLREMASPEGGFFSATDADSEGEEGLFFTWTMDEIRAIAGPDADEFIRHYGVTAQGNFEGRNILCVARPDELAWERLAGARQRLYDVRARRVAPLRDDKILAGWNGLAIGAMALGGRVLGEPRFAEAAVRAARFVTTQMRPEGRLRRTYKDGRAAHAGTLDDHAFMVQGLIELHETTLDPQWLEGAIALSKDVEQHFGGAHGAWFLSPADSEVLIARQRPSYDGAEPSGTSVQILNCLRLAELTQTAAWKQRADAALDAFRPLLLERSLGLTEMLVAVDWLGEPTTEVVITWPAGGAFPRELSEVISRSFLPHRVVLGAPSDQMERLAGSSGLAEGRGGVGRPTAFVCRSGACQSPSTDPATLRTQIAALLAGRGPTPPTPTD